MNIPKIQIKVKYYEKYAVFNDTPPAYIQTICISSFILYGEVLYTLTLMNNDKVVYHQDTILSVFPNTIKEFLNIHYPATCEVLHIEFTPDVLHDPIRKSLVGLIGPIPKQLDKTIIEYINHVIVKNIKK